jgi:hypothetical protein
MEASHAERKITIHIRENFGDGLDRLGLPIGLDAERRLLHRHIDDAIQHIISPKESHCDPQRWLSVEMESVL